MDGETIKINVPSEHEVSELITKSNESFKLHMGKLDKFKSHLLNMDAAACVISFVTSEMYCFLVPCYILMYTSFRKYSC